MSDPEVVLAADQHPDGSTTTARELLRDRSIAAFLTAACLSTLALSAQATALGKQVFDLTAREIDLGWLGLAEFAPAALLVVVAGNVADRHDRRRVAFWGYLGEAVCAVGLAALAHGRTQSLGLLLLVVLAFGVARAFQAPAIRALPANIVERSRLPRLTAMNSTAWQAGLIAGPVLGGLLYETGPMWVYVISAGLTLTAALLMTLVAVLPEPPAPEPAPAPVEVVVAALDPEAPTAEAPPAPKGLVAAIQGLGVIRRTPVLFGAITLDLFAVLFGGAIALLPAIADKRLGVDAVGLGWLRAAGGLGAAGMGLMLAIGPLRRRIGRTLFIVVAIFGAATIGLGWTHSYWVAFAMMIVLSGADAVSVNIRSTISPLVVTDSMRGRVLAVENVFIGASNELGAFESGVVGQLIGASGAIIGGGIATLVVVVVGAAAFPSLRGVDRWSDLHPTEE